MALGLFHRSSQGILAWGGAILVGLQLARAVTLVSVTQIRLAGFQMLRREDQRITRVARGETVVLRAEVRNRDVRAARYVHLRTLCSPHLDVTLEPDFGEVPAGGRLEVNVQICGKRVGRHGIFGLNPEVQGGPGLYEVPLTFSNPLGIEVLPNAYQSLHRSPRGGRSRYRSDAGNPNWRSRGSSTFASYVTISRGTRSNKSPGKPARVAANSWCENSIAKNAKLSGSCWTPRWSCGRAPAVKHRQIGRSTRSLYRCENTSNKATTSAWSCLRRAN